MIPSEIKIKIFAKRNNKGTLGGKRLIQGDNFAAIEYVSCHSINILNKCLQSPENAIQSGFNSLCLNDHTTLTPILVLLLPITPILVAFIHTSL